MTFSESIILGVLEGLTEFLPISSTGHLILAGHLLGIPPSDFQSTFMIAIQLGSILAVVALFWKKFFDWHMLKLILVAFIPTGILGFLLYKTVKGFLGNPYIVVGALFFGGVALIAIELWNKRRVAQGTLTNTDAPISLTQAFIIGCGQALAMIPGVSRSGATVGTGLLLGLTREQLLMFTFLLAVPTMFVATAYDIYKNPSVLSLESIELLIAGCITAFIVALGTMKAALSFVRKHTFIFFGYYRIALALVFLLFIL